jgi:hypothetical protein
VAPGPVHTRPALALGLCRMAYGVAVALVSRAWWDANAQCQNPPSATFPGRVAKPPPPRSPHARLDSRLSPLEHRRSGCFSHALFRLPAATRHSCNASRRSLGGLFRLSPCRPPMPRRAPGPGRKSNSTDPNSDRARYCPNFFVVRAKRQIASSLLGFAGTSPNWRMNL